MKNKKFFKFCLTILVFSFTLFPFLSLAQTPPGNNTNICTTNYKSITKPALGDVINYVTCTISKSVIPLLFALAVVAFVWGVVQYVINADNEEKRKKGRDFMIWGIVGLAVMVSIWGLVRIFGDTFSINYAIPQVKTNN